MPQLAPLKWILVSPMLWFVLFFVLSTLLFSTPTKYTSKANPQT